MSLLINANLQGISASVTQVSTIEAPNSEKVTSGNVLQKTTNKTINSAPSICTLLLANFIDCNAWDSGGCLFHLPVRGVPCDLFLATVAALTTLALVVVLLALVKCVRCVPRKRATRRRVLAEEPFRVNSTNSHEMLSEL